MEVYENRVKVYEEQTKACEKWEEREKKVQGQGIEKKAGSADAQNVRPKGSEAYEIGYAYGYAKAISVDGIPVPVFGAPFAAGPSPDHGLCGRSSGMGDIPKGPKKKEGKRSKYRDDNDLDDRGREKWKGFRYRSLGKLAG